MKIKEQFSVYRSLISNHLNSFLESKKTESPPEDIFFADVIEKIKTFSLSGKLLRGGMVLMSAEMNGGNIDEKTLNAACAIELIHSSLCIHDDIMDNDLMRRGQKTILAQFKKDNEKQNLYYEQSMAMCVGDIGYFLAMELLADSSDDLETQRFVMQHCMKEFCFVGSAQMMDVQFSQPKESATKEQIMHIYRYKTGRYGFTVPLFVGETLATRKKLFSLEKCTENLGIIFQIMDDKLGLMGDEKILGKTVGSDIRENKKTLFYYALYATASPDEKLFLDASFGNRNLSPQDVKKVQHLAEKNGALELINKELEKLYKITLDQLNNASINEGYKNALRELVEYNMYRDK